MQQTTAACIILQPDYSTLLSSCVAATTPDQRSLLTGCRRTVYRCWHGSSVLAVSDGKYVSIRPQPANTAAPRAPGLLNPIANLLSAQQQVSGQQHRGSRPEPPAIQQLAFNATTPVHEHQQAQSRCEGPHEDDDGHGGLECRNNEASLLAVVAGSSVAVYRISTPDIGTNSSSSSSNGYGSGAGISTGSHAKHRGKHSINRSVGGGGDAHGGASTALAGVLLSSGGAKFRALAWHPSCPHIFAAATQEEMHIVSCQPNTPQTQLPSTIPASAASPLSSTGHDSDGPHQSPPSQPGIGKRSPPSSTSAALGAATHIEAASHKSSCCQVLACLKPGIPQPSPTLCMTWVDRSLAHTSGSSRKSSSCVLCICWGSKDVEQIYWPSGMPLPHGTSLGPCVRTYLGLGLPRPLRAMAPGPPACFLATLDEPLQLGLGLGLQTDPGLIHESSVRRGRHKQRGGHEEGGRGLEEEVGGGVLRGGGKLVSEVGGAGGRGEEQRAGTVDSMGMQVTNQGVAHGAMDKQVAADTTDKQVTASTMDKQVRNRGASQQQQQQQQQKADIQAEQRQQQQQQEQHEEEEEEQEEEGFLDLRGCLGNCSEPSGLLDLTKEGALTDELSKNSEGNEAVAQTLMPNNHLSTCLPKHRGFGSINSSGPMSGGILGSLMNIGASCREDTDESTCTVMPSEGSRTEEEAARGSSFAKGAREVGAPNHDKAQALKAADRSKMNGGGINVQRYGDVAALMAVDGQQGGGESGLCTASGCVERGSRAGDGGEASAMLICVSFPALQSCKENTQQHQPQQCGNQPPSHWEGPLHEQQQLHPQEHFQQQRQQQQQPIHLEGPLQEQQQLRSPQHLQQQQQQQHQQQLQQQHQLQEVFVHSLPLPHMSRPDLLTTTPIEYHTHKPDAGLTWGHHQEPKYQSSKLGCREGHHLEQYHQDTKMGSRERPSQCALLVAVASSSSAALVHLFSCSLDTAASADACVQTSSGGGSSRCNSSSRSSRSKREEAGGPRHMLLSLTVVALEGVGDVSRTSVLASEGLSSQQGIGGAHTHAQGRRSASNAAVTPAAAGQRLKGLVVTWEGYQPSVEGAAALLPCLSITTLQGSLPRKDHTSTTGQLQSTTETLTGTKSQLLPGIQSGRSLAICSREGGGRGLLDAAGSAGAHFTSLSRSGVKAAQLQALHLCHYRLLLPSTPEATFGATREATSEVMPEAKAACTASAAAQPHMTAAAEQGRAPAVWDPAVFLSRKTAAIEQGHTAAVGAPLRTVPGSPALLTCTEAVAPLSEPHAAEEAVRGQPKQHSSTAEGGVQNLKTLLVQMEERLKAHIDSRFDRLESLLLSQKHSGVEGRTTTDL